MKSLDIDGSGQIDANELLLGLQSDEIKLAEVKAFIKRVDKNGDGKLSRDELMAFFEKIGL